MIYHRSRAFLHFKARNAALLRTFDAAAGVSADGNMIEEIEEAEAAEVAAKAEAEQAEEEKVETKED